VERSAVVSVDDESMAAPIGKGHRAARPLGDDLCVFRVKLRGIAGKLGMDLEYVPERAVIPIRNVRGLAAGEWNAANPDFAIRAGDCVVAVGSVQGHAEAMKNALANRSASELQITLVRLASQAEPQDEAFVDAFANLPCIDPDLNPMQSPRVAPIGNGQALPQASAPPDRNAMLREAQKDLATPWQAVWSRSQSKCYYYNPHTNQSVWVKPTQQSTDSPPVSPRKGGSASSIQTPRVGAGTSSDVGQDAILAETVPDNNDDCTEVGLWQYADGTYKIYKRGTQLIYEEEGFGVKGVLAEAEDGSEWLEADLFDGTGGKGPAASKGKNGVPIGRVRLCREGDVIVSNFRPDPGSPWEGDVIAKRISGI